MLISVIPFKSINSSSCCVLLLLLSMMNTAAAEDAVEAKVWLVKMATALQQLNYEGIFVYRADDELAAMKVIHQVGPQGEREVLQTLTGELRQSINEDQQFGHFNKMDSDSGGIPKQLSEVEKYYLLKLGDKDRVAGRPAKVVIVNPRDEYRYGYRLWLDEDTGLLLRSDLLAIDGRVIEQVMFTSMNVAKSQAKRNVIKPQALERSSTESKAPKGKQVITSWRVTRLPAGFVQVENQPVQREAGSVHRIFTDGLASVSLFVEKTKTSDKPFIGVSRMGAVSAFGNVMDGHQLTVVGEVPEATVKMIGASVAR